MNNSINLVKSEDKNVRRRKTLRVLRIISIVFISFVGIVSVIIFILNYRISPSSIRKQQDIALQNIVKEKNKFAKVSLLNDRIKGIRDILNIRKNYTSTLSELVDQVPQGARATSLKIDKGDISLTISSSSLLSINKFLNNILALSLKKNSIKSMTIESLTVDAKTGFYTFSIKAKI